MAKIFYLTLYRIDDDFKIPHSKQAKGETLTEVLSKLPLMVHELERDLDEESIIEFKTPTYNDDIPF